MQRADLGRARVIIELYEFDYFNAERAFSVRCPFLRKVRGKEEYTCLIHDVKPLKCREFPADRETAKNHECPGYD
jgi:Fe-S-cluster containining protein